MRSSTYIAVRYYGDKHFPEAVQSSPAVLEVREGFY